MKMSNQIWISMARYLAGEMKMKEEIVGAVGTLLNSDYSLYEAYFEYRDKARLKGVDVKKIWRIDQYFNYLEIPNR